MMIVDDKQRLIDAVTKDLAHYKAGFFLTLNALTDNYIVFEAQIDQMIYWLNCYCYGRSFKNKKKRLRSVGVSEVGKVEEGLHTHMVVMHNDDTKRTMKDIERYVRRKWYRLVRSKPNAWESGNLVDFQYAYDVSGCVEYITKTFHHQSNQFNLQYF